MEKRRSLGMLVMVGVTVVLAGCATRGFGPPGSTGKATVRSQAVENTNPFSVRFGGKTFCVFSDDKTGKADMRSELASELRAIGMREVTDPKQADHIFDLSTEIYESGLGNGPVEGKVAGAVAGTAAGVGLAESGALDPGSAAAVGVGIALAGALLDAYQTPNYVFIEVSLVVDERTRFIGEKKTKIKGEKEFVRHETTLRDTVNYFPNQVGELEAVGVLRANLIAEMVKPFR
jgi:hypothetical protein